MVLLHFTRNRSEYVYLEQPEYHQITDCPNSLDFHAICTNVYACCFVATTTDTGATTTVTTAVAAARRPAFVVAGQRQRQHLLSISIVRCSQFNAELTHTYCVCAQAKFENSHAQCTVRNAFVMSRCATILVFVFTIFSGFYFPKQYQFIEFNAQFK